MLPPDLDRLRQTLDAQRSRGEHAFRGPAGAHIHVDRGIGIGHRDYTGNIAIGDQLDAATDRTQLRNQLVMARAIKNAYDDFVRLHALCFGNSGHIFGN